MEPPLNKSLALPCHAPLLVFALCGVGEGNPQANWSQHIPWLQLLEPGGVPGLVSCCRSRILMRVGVSETPHTIRLLTFIPVKLLGINC